MLVRFLALPDFLLLEQMLSLIARKLDNRSNGPGFKPCPSVHKFRLIENLVKKSASFQTQVDSISQGMTQEKRGNTNTNSNGNSNTNKNNSNGSNRPQTNEVRKNQCLHFTFVLFKNQDLLQNLVQRKCSRVAKILKIF